MANCCVICFRVELTKGSSDLKVGGVEHHSKGHDICRRYFQLLERYLNDGVMHDGSEEKNMPGNFPLEEVLSIGMISCRECDQVMHSFCQLYDELKKIELLLNCKLWMVKNRMESAHKMTPRVISFRESIRQLEMEDNFPRSISSGDEIYELVMKSKKVLIDKCSNRLIRGFPKLPITRLKEPVEIPCEMASSLPECTILEDAVPELDKPVEKLEGGKLNLISELKSFPAKCSSDIIKLENVPVEEIPLGGSQSNASETDNYLSDYDEEEPHLDSPIESSSDEIDDDDHKTNVKLFSNDEISNSKKLDHATANPEKAVAAETFSEPEHSETRRESQMSRHSLRRVLPCGRCNRTFSSKERLTAHRTQCSADLQNKDDDDIRKGDLVMEVADTASDCNYDDTDTSDTSDDGDEDNNESEEEMAFDAVNLNPGQSEKDRVNSSKIARTCPTGNTTAAHISPWICPTCKNPYRQKRCLDEHILLKHPEQWTSRSNKNSISGHPQIEPTAGLGAVTDGTRSMPRETLKVAYRFKCEDCNSLFINMEALLIHRHCQWNCHPSILNRDRGTTTKVELLYFSGKHALEKVKRIRDSSHFATLEVPDQGVILCHQKGCNRPFYTEEDMKSHQKLHGKFKCSFCKVVKTYAPDLAEHELIHSKSKPIKKGTVTSNNKPNRPVCNRKCLRCNHIFRTKMSYISHHLIEHMSLTLITNSCAICNSFHDSVRSAAIRHYKLYHDINNVDPESVKRCKVENCCSYFLTLSQLVKHHKVRHGASQIKDIITKERKMHKCPDCDQILTSLLSLKRHRVKYHTAEESLLHCSVEKCKFTCDTEADLKSHVYYRHSVRNMEFIDCPKCSKSCNGVSSLKMHMRSHSKKVVVRSVSSRRRLDRPVVTGPSNYRFKCPDCSHLFSRLDSLLAHRKKSHQINNDMEVTTNSEQPNNMNKITVEILSFPHKIIPTLLDKARAFKLFEKIQVVDNIHICSVDSCQRPFHFSADLETHSKLHGKFQCNFCDVVKENAPEIAEHEWTHSDKACQEGSDMATATTSSWNCPRPRCNLTFVRKEKYLAHYLATHLNLPLVDDRKCAICEISGWVTGRNSDLMKHYKVAHGISESSPSSVKNCEFVDCEAYFVTKKALATHIKSQHGSDPHQILEETFICKDCGKTLKNLSCLRAHRRNIHPASTNLFPCSVPKCNIACETLEELESHKKLRHCSGMDFIDCPKCKKSFNGKGSFNMHMRAHERKEKGLVSVSLSFVCDACGKICPSRMNLELHSLSHSGSESWAFTCSVCSKKCLTQQKLDEHMRIHSKEKPFVCQICGQKYAHRHNLRIHVNNKHGDVTEDRPTKIHKRKAGSKAGIKRKRKRGSDDDDSSE